MEPEAGHRQSTQDRRLRQRKGAGEQRGKVGSRSRRRRGGVDRLRVRAELSPDWGMDPHHPNRRPGAGAWTRVLGQTEGR